MLVVTNVLLYFFSVISLYSIIYNYYHNYMDIGDFLMKSSMGKILLAHTFRDITGMIVGRG